MIRKSTSKRLPGFTRRHRLQVGVTGVLLAFTFLAHAQVYVGGHITQNTVYSKAGNPFIVIQDLIVDSGIVLQIKPGVILKFEQDVKLVNNGRLLAIGTLDQPILMEPKVQWAGSGYWNGIELNNSSNLQGNPSDTTSSFVRNAILQQAKYGITLDQGTSVLVDSNRFDRCSFGIYIRHSIHDDIRRNAFAYCDYGVYFGGGFDNQEITIEENSFSFCNEAGISLSNLASFTYGNIIRDNNIEACKTGIFLGNAGMTGSARNRVTGNKVFRNNTGLVIYQDSNLIQGNYFLQGNTGALLEGCTDNQISQNLFAGNADWGINSRSGAAKNRFSFNTFAGTAGGAMFAPAVKQILSYNSFIFNSIYDNSTNGSLNFLEFNGPCQFNNLVWNGNYQSCANVSGSNINVSRCYWGTDHSPAIDSIILDGADNGNPGMLEYDPAEPREVVLAPILPPYRAFKQLIGNKVLVRWDSSSVADLKGYRVYEGVTKDLSWRTATFTPDNTPFAIQGGSIFDSIGVTSLDLDWDNELDQLQGHESYFRFARTLPYAGPDTAVCLQAPYKPLPATAPGLHEVHWTTSGDGAFDDAYQLHPEYTPGPVDFANRFAYLTLHARDSAGFVSDICRVELQRNPVYRMNADTLLYFDASFVVGFNTITNPCPLHWITSGDGSFDNDTLLHPAYTPGIADWSRGYVILTCVLQSACGLYSFPVTIHFAHTLSLSGRIHSTSLATLAGSRVDLNASHEASKTVQRSVSDVEGNFRFSGLQPGQYYLHAFPPNGITSLLPTFYPNDVHWANSFLMELNKDTYDVDIVLQPVSGVLPVGEGVISGKMASSAAPGADCGDYIVFLMDGSAGYYYSWQYLTPQAGFRFEGLPYGDYRLKAEKTAAPSPLTNPIILTPEVPQIENIVLDCQEGLFKMHPGPDANSIGQGCNCFPVPARDYVNFPVSPQRMVTLVMATDILGRQHEIPYQYSGASQLGMNIGTLENGIYFIHLYAGRTRVGQCKILKAE